MSSVLEALSVRFLGCGQLGYPEGAEIPRFGDNWIVLEFLQVASLLALVTSLWEGHVSSESSLSYQEALHGT